MSVLHEMWRSQLDTDLISYIVAISACEKGKHWKLALALLSECNAWVTPCTISYSAAVSACEKGMHWDLALERLNECKTWTTPNPISYSAAIIGCEKAGQ